MVYDTPRLVFGCSPKLAFRPQFPSTGWAFEYRSNIWLMDKVNGRCCFVLCWLICYGVAGGFEKDFYGVAQRQEFRDFGTSAFSDDIKFQLFSGGFVVVSLPTPPNFLKFICCNMRF